MKRWFYTDPLAAAWMAKHFGMIFDHPHFPYGYGDLVRIAEEEDRVKRQIIGKHSVHPDSLHLLGPRVGDLVSLAGKVEGAVLLVGSTENGFYYRHYGIAHHACGWGNVDRTIQRNGLSFHWPESDEA